MKKFDLRKVFSPKKRQGTLSWEEYLKRLEERPRDDRLRLKFADLLIGANRRQEAAEQFRILADRYSNESAYWKAIVVLKRIVEIGFATPEIHLKLGELFQQVSLPKEAEEEFRKAIAISLARQEIDAGIEAAQRWVCFDRMNPEGRFQLAMLYAKGGRFEERDRELEQLEQLLVLQGRREDRMSYYERVLEVDPKDYWARRGYALSVLQEGNLEEGVRLLQELVEEGRVEDRIMESLIRGFFRLGKEEEASRFFDFWIEDLARHHRSDKVSEVRQWFEKVRSGREESIGEGSERIRIREEIEERSSNRQSLEGPVEGIDPYLDEAELCWEYGLQDRAFQQLFQALRRSPRDPAISAKALSWVEGPASELPLDSLIPFVELLLREGEIPSAKRILEVMVQQMPQNAEAQEVLSFLNLEKELSPS